MKLQPREQSVIGIVSIGIVLFFSWFGIGSLGIEPQLKSLTQNLSELDTAKRTEDTNNMTLSSLKQKKQDLSGHQAEMPKDKKVGEIDHQSGETLEIVKREMLSDVIDMGQNSFGNTLIHVRPLPIPEPPPAPVLPPPAPGQAIIDTGPELKLSDFLAEIPYEIALRGSYKSINEFINQLASYNTIIDIQQLAIDVESENSSATSDPKRPLKAIFKITYLIKK